MKSFHLLLFAVAAFLFATSSATISTMHFDKVDDKMMMKDAKLWHELRFNLTTKTYHVSKNEQDGILHARAFYNDSYYLVGWDRLYVEPTKQLLTTDLSQAYYAAGYIEGVLTWDRIIPYYNNNVLRKVQYANAHPAAWKWVNEHIAHMQTQVEKYGKKTSPPSPNQAYYQRLGYMLQQIQGLYEGYNALQNANYSLTYQDIFMLSFQWEFDDVKIATATGNPPPINNMQRFVDDSSHCSAFIKITDTDLFFSHVSWTYLGQMQRLYKTYAFDTVVSMSSFPAVIHSIDDWYITSNSLAVQETTNIIYNTSLTKEYVIPQTVSEFFRVMIANYIATGGKTWVKLFEIENSGTYCNQWMVVDMKIYVPREDLPENLFWVAEQLPGSVTSADKTSHLASEGYWASYNVPYFTNVYKLSGNLEMFEKFGNYFSYTKYARPEIFKRDHGLVHSIADMMWLMRYNDFQHDSLSIIPNCTGAMNNTCHPTHSSMLSIASRGDLMPKATTERFGCMASWVGQQDLAAVDAKITSWSYMQDGKQHGVVQCGPTYDQQPPFRWSTSPFADTIPHEGMPDLFHFPWVDYELP